VTSPPKSRQLKDTEVYSKLFYESKLKDIVGSETAGMSLSEKFVRIGDVTRQEWANESDEVKEQVRAMKGESRNRRHQNSATPSLEQYQASINDLSYVVNTFLDHIRQTTGWTGFVVLGGPKPDIGGEIAIGSYVLNIDYLLKIY
jgi:hypothetical protein